MVSDMEFPSHERASNCLHRLEKVTNAGLLGVNAV